MPANRVVYNSSGSVFTQGGTNNLSFNLTANAGSVLLVYTVHDNSSSISSIAYNGVQLTQFKSMVSISTRCAELWVLSAPDAGVNILSAAWKLAGGRCVIGVTYDNVKQIGGFGNITTQLSNVSVATVNLSVSATATDMISMIYVIPNNNTILAMNNPTANQRVLGSISTSTRVLVGDIMATGPTTSISATASAASTWILFGVPLHWSAQPAVGSRSMMGTGL